MGKMFIMSERQILLIKEYVLNEARLKSLNTIPASSYIFSLCDPNFESLQLLNTNFRNSYILQDRNTGKNLWYYEKSNSEGSLSEYYEEINPSGGVKTIMRASNHWSYYIIPNYQIKFRGKQESVSLIFGTQNGIRNDRHYSLVLPQNYRSMVDKNAILDRLRMSGRYRYPSQDGSCDDFLLLDYNVVFPGLGIDINKSLFGEAKTQTNDLWVINKGRLIN